MEWWFVQGYYEGRRCGRRHFMASVFRHQMDPGAKGDPNSFSLLLSVLGPGGGRQHTHTRIDQATVDGYLRAREEIKGVNLDKRLAEAYAQEVAAFGPPAPIVLDKTPVDLSSRPLRLTWNDFMLAQESRGFVLSFSDPETGKPCRFTLSPLRPRIYIEGIGEPATSAMPYATYPSLRLEGKAGREPVTGEAWFDHQWGADGAWAVTKTRRKRLVGWDWFGINLDDGTDLLLIVHRDMKNGRSLSRSAVVRGRGKGPEVFHDLFTTPLCYWESPDSRVRYPVAWRIVIPRLQADLVFTPFAEDQEIRVYGGARAIWEGAGSVAGSFRRRHVTGRGRLELHGYGYIFDFKEYCGSFSKRIDAEVEAYFPASMADEDIRRFLGPPHWKHDASAYNEAIARPVWDLMARRGKQWRAIFNILLLDTLGVSHRPYLDLASVIPELCHTGSLIIDDIEDNSRMRRGDACIHLRYGVDVAINAANTIYFLPFLLIADHKGLDEDQRVQIYKIVFRAFARAHFGQGLDIYRSKTLSQERLSQWLKEDMGSKILQMYADKTSSFIEAAAESTCIIARVGPATRAACISFARTLGVAFQITDDVLNFSTSPKWGKISGEDLSEGKLTYVIHRAFQALAPQERKRLRQIFCSKRLREKEAHGEGVALIRGSGALEACRKEAQVMVDEAWAPLSKLIPPSEPKIMLRMLCSSLLDIVYES